MDILRRHEVFEIELLEKLKNGDFLKPLVFGGGTMLRLCYELNRYSAVLDFWFIKKLDQREYFQKLKEGLAEFYELTDARIKFKTLLLEIRSKSHPRRLKVEIRREIKKCDFQEKIAFSKYATKQVILRAHTLEQTLRNKIEAALDRKDVRDFFDLEFLLRQGVALNSSVDELGELKDVAGSFKENDYRVSLGSIFESDMRRYYIMNKFDYLIRKINLSLLKDKGTLKGVSVNDLVMDRRNVRRQEHSEL